MCIPCRLPSFLWQRIAQSSQRIVVLKCPSRSCFAGKQERKTELGHKESSPAPFDVAFGLPHYGARSPSHPCLEILVGIVSPDAVPGLFSPLPCSIPPHPHPCSPTLPLPGVKWGKFQSGVNVYCLLETLKNKNSSWTAILKFYCASSATIVKLHLNGCSVKTTWAPPGFLPATTAEFEEMLVGCLLGRKAQIRLAPG